MDIKVFIVDDHQLFIDGIKAILSKVVGIEIVGSALSGKECITIIKKMDVDVLISDISMPEMKGDELVGHITKFFPNIKTLALSMHDDYTYIEKMLASGASGYILKNTGVTELKEAIFTVYKGENYFSPKVSDSIAKGYVKSSMNIAPKNEASNDDVFLTRREKSVLKLVFAGMSSQIVADELNLSYHTVTQHRKNINAKLGTHVVSELEHIVKTKNLL